MKSKKRKPRKPRKGLKQRGRGTKKKPRRLKLAKHRPKDEHGRKFYHPGERISYLNGRNQRVTGKVIGVRKEFYLVERKGLVYKVDRHSIFSQLGGALKSGASELKAYSVKAKDWIGKQFKSDGGGMKTSGGGGGSIRVPKLPHKDRPPMGIPKLTTGKKIETYPDCPYCGKVLKHPYTFCPDCKQRLPLWVQRELGVNV